MYLTPILPIYVQVAPDLDDKMFEPVSAVTGKVIAVSSMVDNLCYIQINYPVDITQAK